MLRELEEGILGLIRQQVPELKTVKGYEGDFDRGTMREILGLMPCALVVYEGQDLEERNMDLLRKVRFTVLVGARSYRKGEAREEAFELLEAVEGALVGQRVEGLKMLPLALRSERLVYRDSQIVVFGQSYETTVFERKTL